MNEVWSRRHQASDRTCLAVTKCPLSTQQLGGSLWLNPSEGQTPAVTGHAVHRERHCESWGLGTELENSMAPTARVRAPPQEGQPHPDLATDSPA